MSDLSIDLILRSERLLEPKKLLLIKEETAKSPTFRDAIQNRSLQTQLQVEQQLLNEHVFEEHQTWVSLSMWIMGGVIY